MADDDLLGSDDIAALFAQAKAGLPGAQPAAAPAAPPPPAASSSQNESNLLGEGELEALLMGAGAAQPPAQKPVATTAPPPPKPKPGPSSTERRTAELLNKVDAGLDAVMREDRRGRSNVSPDAAGAKPYELADFSGAQRTRGRAYELQSLDDVELDLHIELGRAELMIEEVLSLAEGAVVQLDKMAGDPVDIVVNGRLVARGEVLVLNENFCVRVAEIVTPDY